MLEAPVPFAQAADLVQSKKMIPDLSTMLVTVCNCSGSQATREDSGADGISITN